MQRCDIMHTQGVLCIKQAPSKVDDTVAVVCLQLASPVEKHTALWRAAGWRVDRGRVSSYVVRCPRTLLKHCVVVLPSLLGWL